MRNRKSLLRASKWSITILAAVLILYAGYSWIAVSRYQVIPLQSGTIPPDYVEFRGVDHIHTNASEGAGSPEEILAAAKRAGLDFVVITDHNTMSSWEKEQWNSSSSPLLLKGIEISTKSGHLLGLGLKKTHAHFSREAQDAINEIRSLGGIAVLSHPTRPKTPWRNFSVEDFSGIEILNMNNVFSSVSRFKLLFLFPQACFNQKGALTSLLDFETSALSLWDTLNTRSKIYGFYGADAHGPAFIGVPSYEAIFGVASLHLVARRPAADTLTEDVVRTLLAKGSFYMAIDGLSLSTYVDFQLVRDGVALARIGETCRGIRKNDQLKFDALAPEGAAIVLMRNGTPYEKFEDSHFDIPLKLPGAYRIEIVIPKERNPYGVEKRWIVTNHITVL